MKNQKRFFFRKLERIETVIAIDGPSISLVYWVERVLEVLIFVKKR